MCILPQKSCNRIVSTADNYKYYTQHQLSWRYKQSFKEPEGRWFYHVFEIDEVDHAQIEVNVIRAFDVRQSGEVHYCGCLKT
jgi:hypothetical protein